MHLIGPETKITFGGTPQEARENALGSLPTDHASINAFAWARDQYGGYCFRQIAFGETPQEARGDALGGLPTDHASINASDWARDQYCG